MDWTLVLAILCLTAASAMADNQTGENTTSPNTTVFNLVFSINETFDPLLANTSSPNFTAKAESIRNQIEPVYRQRFSNFIRMVINSFSNGSIVTNSSLEFSSNGTIPTVSAVNDTLVNATNTTSSLNIIASSINVTQVPGTNTTTNTSGNTTSPNTPVVAAAFNLVFSINETFVPALANTSSPEFKSKALSIRNQLEPVYRQRFSNFIRMVINSFSNGSIVTNSSLEFSSNGATPTVSEVQDTLVNATNTNSSLNIIASSINVPQVPGTNTTTNTSTNTTVVAAAFNLVFSINETFVPALANTSSPEFKAKALSISNQIEPVYRQRFSNFIRMVINSFSNGSIVTNSSLEFSSNGTTPTVSEVQDTLVNATNTTSSLNIIASSINVPQVPVTNTTSNTSGNTTSPNTPVVAAAFNLVFSINETFDPSLANTSSPNFTAKAQSIRNQIEPVYRKRFNNFIRMVINSFRNGSIVTDSSLEFSSNGTIPTVSEVKGTLVNATNTTSSLNIIPSSITVTQTFGNSTTTPTSNSMSLVIASSRSMIWMSLLTLLLSVALHF